MSGEIQLNSQPSNEDNFPKVIGYDVLKAKYPGYEFTDIQYARNGWLFRLELNGQPPVIAATLTTSAFDVYQMNSLGGETVMSDAVIVRGEHYGLEGNGYIVEDIFIMKFLYPLVEVLIRFDKQVDDSQDLFLLNTGEVFPNNL